MNKALILAVLLLAGCLGGKPAADAETPSAAPPMTELSGFVVAADAAPVEGATVRLDEFPEEQSTDAQGAYRFVHVEPGEHTVNVAKEGFLPARERASVREGYSTLVNVTLESAPPEVFHFTQDFTGLISCHATVKGETEASLTQDCSDNDPNEASSHDFLVAAGPAQLQVEAFWTPTSAAARNLTLRVETVDEGALNVILVNEVGSTGMKAVIGAADTERYIAQNATLRVTMASAPSIGTAIGAGFALQQTFEVALTAFYGEPGAADFSYRSP